MSAPVLTTARYELWQPQVGDLADLFELTRDEETRRFLGSFTPTEMDSFTRLTRNAGSWALWGYGTFMVRRKGEAHIVANCGVFRSHRGFGESQGLDNVPKPAGSSTAMPGARASPAKSWPQRSPGSTPPTAASASPA